MKKAIVLCMLLFSMVVAFSQSKEKAEVKKVLDTFKRAMEEMDASGTIPKLFTEDAMVYENGDPGDKVADFVKEHMYPEFEMFSSFTYSNYKADITISGEYAYTTETYDYTIVLKKDGKPITPSSMGVVTAVLKKTNMGWRYVSFHSSYRKKKAS